MRALGFVSFLICAALITSAANAEVDNTGFFSTFDNIHQKMWYISNGWSNGDHQSCEWRADNIKKVDDALQMTLADNGGQVRPIGCGEIQTTAKLGYGLYEARMKVATGSGLNTAFFTYIGPPMGVPEWDEIDFEFLGKNTHYVQAGYYRNGKAQPVKWISLGFDASADFHNYAIEWLPNKIRWYVDGKQSFETPADATIPINPGHLFFSLWSGSKVEDSWLGRFDYSSPVTAEVAWSGYTPLGKKCLFSQSMTCK